MKPQKKTPSDHDKSEGESEEPQQPAKRTQRRTKQAKQKVSSSEPDCQSGRP